MTVSVIQVGLQWLCFTLVFVLYMIYYPQHLKYVVVDAGELGDEDEVAAPLLPQPYPEFRLKSVEWRLSLTAAWIAGVHFLVMAVTTLFLTIPPPPHNSFPLEDVDPWATVLGVAGSVLAAIQYVPKLVHTYRSKLVGTLSIPMMAIQTPGGLFIVVSVLFRLGTKWTRWTGFLVAAFLQGCLLIMCIVWRVRQRKLGIDDFENPILPAFPRPDEDEGGPVPI